MAIVYWTGAAQDVQQEVTYTATGTWAAGDTVSYTINKKTLTLTLGTDVATTDVVAESAAMINSLVNDSTTKVGAYSDETWNFSGRSIPEFSEIEASASGSVLTLKGTAGIPFTLTATESTAGNGSIGSATTVTAATGKHFVDNGDNYLGGSAPSNGDSVVCNRDAPDMKYAIDWSLTDISLLRTYQFTGNIGLPDINTLGYIEYRPRYLILEATGGGSQSLFFGQSGEPIRDKGWSRIDTGTTTGTACNLEVRDGQSRLANGRPALEIIGDNTLTTCYIQRGSVDIGSTVASASPTISAFRTTYITDQESDVDVRIGSGCNWSGGAIDIGGGKVSINSNSGTPTFTMTAGKVIHDCSDSYSGNAMILGGVFEYLSGAVIPELYGGATFDMRKATDTLSSSSQPQFYKGYRYYDPKGYATWSNGIDFIATIPGNVDGQVFQVKPNRNWVDAAV